MFSDLGKGHWMCKYSRSVDPYACSILQQAGHNGHMVLMVRPVGIRIQRVIQKNVRWIQRFDGTIPMCGPPSRTCASVIYSETTEPGVGSRSLIIWCVCVCCVDRVVPPRHRSIEKRIEDGWFARSDNSGGCGRATVRKT